MNMKTAYHTIITTLTALLLLGSAVSFAQTDTLTSSSSLYGDGAKVDMPFRVVEKGDIASAVSSLNVSELQNYDYRTWVNVVPTGRMVGLMGAANIRGIGIGIDVAAATSTGTSSGNALFIVDGLPREIGTMRASEVESITVLKDANAAALYGAQAINGVILIKTKRGIEGKSTADVYFNSGLRSPIELPSYMNSADYMTWYNQARVNDGLEPLYSDQDIENYRSGNPYRYPSTQYYSDEWLRKFKNYYDVNAEFRGGNKTAKYYVNAGWYSEGSLIDFGEWSSARRNTLNFRTNADIRVNSWIDTQVDATAMFLHGKSGRGNLWNAAYSNAPNLYAPLLPIDLIDPNCPELLSHKNDADGKYLFGGTTNYTSSVFSYGYAGGTTQSINHRYTFNDRINFDLKAITEGLAFHTNMSFDYGIFYSQNIYNNVSVYVPTWSDEDDTIIALQQIGSDSHPGTQAVSNPYFQRRMGFSASLDYDRTFNNVHHVYANVLAYANQYKYRLSSGTSEDSGSAEELQGVKQAHLGFQLNYVYDKRYVVDFSANYANSTKLAPGHNRAFSPTAGLAWVVSNEPFLKDVSFLNLLKVHVSGGVLNADVGIDDFYLYEDKYQVSGTFKWNESGRSRTGVTQTRGGNNNLQFEKRAEITGGIEAALFGNTLGFEANVFFERYSGMISRTSSIWPGFYTNFIANSNFDEDSYKGAEAGLSYNKKWGDFNLFVAANVLYTISNVEKRDEIYSEKYLYRAGHPVGGTWGLEALGLFQSQDEIDNSPTQTYGTVRPGDIKYKDQNGDGQIDDNDQIYLRNATPPFSGGIELRLGYKGFTLLALGNASWGKDNYSILGNEYYWVDSTDPYPTHVKDSWTPSNPNAKWPALTTTTAANNNRRSTFWMYDNSFFQMRKIQLSYSLPKSLVRKVYMSKFDVFIDCSSPFQIAPNLHYRQLSVNSEPQYQTYSVGLRASF